MESIQAENAARSGEAASGSAGSGTHFRLRPPPEDTLILEDSLETAAEEAHAVGPEPVAIMDAEAAMAGVASGGEHGEHGADVRPAEHDVAASGAASTAASRERLPGSSTNESGGRRVQTNLDKWLL